MNQPKLITPQSEFEAKVLNKLKEIRALFKEEVKVTLMVRNPVTVNANIFMTQETQWDEIIREINRLMENQKKKIQ